MLRHAQEILSSGRNSSWSRRDVPRVTSAWYLYEGIKPAGAWLSIPAAALLGYVAAAGGAFHGSVAGLALIVQARVGTSPETQTVLTHLLAGRCPPVRRATSGGRLPGGIHGQSVAWHGDSQWAHSVSALVPARKPGACPRGLVRLLPSHSQPCQHTAAARHCQFESTDLVRLLYGAAVEWGPRTSAGQTTFA